MRPELASAGLLLLNADSGPRLSDATVATVARNTPPDATASPSAALCR